jgi:hypothetical protein
LSKGLRLRIFLKSADARVTGSIKLFRRGWLAMDDITIHVDYNPDHSAMTFQGDGGAILTFNPPTSRQLANLDRLRQGKPYSGELPRGWVLIYEESWCDGRTSDERVPLAENGADPGDYATGIIELTEVDEAVAEAREYLARMGYRPPSD